MPPAELAAAAVLGAAWVLATVAERVEPGAWLEPDDVTTEDRVRELRELYATGELTLPDFEHRVALALDADACHLRTQLERADGVGPETSAAVAARFATVECVAAADAGELERVDGVGPERAAAMLDAVGAE